MEILNLISSFLLENKDVVLWFWGGLGILTTLRPLFNFPSKKIYSYDELTKKTRKFNDLKNHWLLFFTLWLIFTGILYLLLSQVDKWSIKKFDIQFHPLMTICVSSLGIFQAVFAFSEDVFPIFKSWDFIYGKVEEVHKVAKTQLFIVFAVDLFSILLFFLLLQLL